MVSVEHTRSALVESGAEGFIRNRETSLQILTGRAGQLNHIERWRDGGAAILSVFVLRGAGLLSGNGMEAHAVLAGQHIMYRVPDTTHVTIAPLDDSDFHAVAFQFSDAYLQRHCPENCPNLCRLTKTSVVATLQPLGNGVPMTTQAEQRALISQICDTTLPMHLQSIYRDIKIAELLVLQLEEILYERKERGGNHLLDHELQRVYQVRDILRTNPSKSYTLLGLAHAVGTNDATLKKHFKQVFGSTVFTYLTSCRMEVAKTLLVEEQKTIAEIAQHLGYKHVSHFSSAFKKYYGCAPTRFLTMD